MSPTVLIIEDAVELAEVIQATLEHMKIDAHHETHGERGLVAFSRVKPDLVLLDIALPDIKGWKILERIKKISQDDNDIKMPKIVIISAYGDPANRLMGRLQDVTSYLIKPFTPDEVEKIVSGALGLNNQSLPKLPKLDKDPVAEILGLEIKPAAPQKPAPPASKAKPEAKPVPKTPPITPSLPVSNPGEPEGSPTPKDTNNPPQMRSGMPPTNNDGDSAQP